MALGALAAHALKGRLTADQLSTFEIGVRYQMYHALGLVALASVLDRWPGASGALWAGWGFVAGTLLFSCSLYALALGGPRWLGVVAPLGGAAFIAGWLLLAWAAWTGRG